MPITVANFKHVAEGVQEDQFTIGERTQIDALADLDPTYRQLLDAPVTAALAVVRDDGRVSLTPVWIDYEDDKVLFNFADHRRKCAWLRSRPECTALLMNPENPYHWLSIRATVTNEIHEDDADGERATETIDTAWTKYTGNEPPYAMRDPARDERRVLFECTVSSVSTFGTP